MKNILEDDRNIIIREFKQFEDELLNKFKHFGIDDISIIKSEEYDMEYDRLPKNLDTSISFIVGFSDGVEMFTIINIPEFYNTFGKLIKENDIKLKFFNIIKSIIKIRIENKLNKLNNVVL